MRDEPPGLEPTQSNAQRAGDQFIAVQPELAMAMEELKQVLRGLHHRRLRRTGWRPTTAAVIRSAMTMRGAKLTETQVAAIAKRMQPIVGYLQRLETWMVKERFPVNDELYLLTREACRAAHNLLARVH